MAIYYVDTAAANDNGAGTSTATAWKTISKVNASSFSAGDSILFKRGCTWREQLTAPSSGSAGSVITFGAYGSGADPIISGADVMTGWEASWPSTTAVSNTLDGGNLANDWNFRILIAGGTFASDGSAVTVTLNASSAATSSVAGVYIGEKAASGDAFDMEPGTIAQILFSGIGTATVAQNGSLTSDALTYAFDKTKNYIVSIGVSAGGVKYKVIAGSGNYFLGSASASAGTANVTGYASGAGNWWGLQAFTITVPTGGSQANTWAVTTPAQVYRAWFDGTLGTKRASLVALSADGDWFADASRLYTYRADDVDPDTAYASIEAAQRTYCLNANGKNYLTVSGLTLTRANSYGVAGGGTNVTVTQNTIRDLGGEQSFGGYGFLTTAADGVATNNTIALINGSGLGSTAAGFVATGNTITDCWNGLEYPNQIGRGVYVGGDGASVQRNTIARSSGGVFVTGSEDSTIAYNVFYGQKVNSIDVQAGVAVHPTLVYNNTILHHPTGVAGHGIVAQLATASIVIKNNLVYCDFDGSNTNVQCVAVDATDYNDVDIDYNLYFLAVGSTADIAKLGATTYTTLADWKTALAGTSYSGKDAHALSADPLLTSVSTPNFRLQSTSPCRDAGVAVGLTTDYAGKTVPRGSLPDMGAYEWYPSNSDATTAWDEKIDALLPGDSTTDLHYALITAWAAASNPKDITTVFRDS